MNSNLGCHVGLEIVGLFTEDEAEINVEVEPINVDHDIFQVSITDTKEVCRRTISSKGFDVVRQNSIFVILRVLVSFGARSHLLFNAILVIWEYFFLNFGYCRGIGDELQQAIVDGK